MKDNPQFNLSFVAVVEKYEILYNHNLDNYSNKHTKERAWQEVAEKIQGIGN